MVVLAKNIFLRWISFPFHFNMNRLLKLQQLVCLVPNGDILGMRLDSPYIVHTTRVFVRENLPPSVINPRCACAARVTVLGLCVCVCLSVCVSVTQHLTFHVIIRATNNTILLSGG